MASSEGGGDGGSGVLVKVRDSGVQGKELLSPSSSLEAQLASLLPPGGTVRLLNQVVTACRRSDLDVLHGVEHGKFSNRRTVAPQLVGVDDVRHVVLTEQPGEEGAGRLGVPVRLEQDVKHGAVLVHRPP